MTTERHQPLVSVLMTVYNREAFLAEAIESVLANTYPHWELIITDDQSKDGSLQIAKRYAEKDARIKVFLNEENLGDYPNRNKAASYATGAYLKYVDADDLLYPFGLEQLIHYMEQFPDAGYGLCSLQQDKKSIYPFQLSPRETYTRHYIQNIPVFYKAPLSSIIRRSVFEAESGFANVRHFGDFELWLRLSKKYPIVLMPQGIAWYRSSEGQEAAVRQKNPLNALKTFKAGLSHIEAGDCPLPMHDQLKVATNYKQQIASLILFSYRKLDFKKAKELKLYSGMSFYEILNYKVR